MKPLILNALLAAVLLASSSSLAHAGPPLICHPFASTGSQLLPWGTGEGWNTPDHRYDLQRLSDDILRLLSPDAPVFARMENMRRAAIYAGRDQVVAARLLRALVARASAKDAGPVAWFDAGYLIESYKQAAHLHAGPPPVEDGYAMVLRAIGSSGGNVEMEFAAALMTKGAQADAHLRRAKAAAATRPLLAQNIENLWR